MAADPWICAFGSGAAFRITGTFYIAMVLAGYVIEILFGGLGLVPTHRSATVMNAGFHWNYTTWLNLAFLVLSIVLVVRFLRTGGPGMLRMMSQRRNGMILDR